MIIYDRKSDITWRDGAVTSAAELAKNPVTEALTTDDCVLFDNGAGVVYSWRRLADLKAEYGVTEEDPEAALEAVKTAMAKPKPTVEELQAIIDALLGGE